MDQSLEPLGDPCESTEGHETRDDRVRIGTNGESGGSLRPRILSELLDGQGDTVPIRIDAGHEHAYRVSYRVDRRRVHRLVPGDLRTMDQAVGDADVDEQPEAGDVGHRTVEHVADAELGGGARLPLPPELLDRGLLGEDEPVPLWIDLDDLQREGAALERSDGGGYRGRSRLIGDAIDGADRAQLRLRHETAKADVDDDAATIHLDDRRLDDVPALAALREF